MIILYLYLGVGLLIGIWWFIDNWKYQKSRIGYYNGGKITLFDVFIVIGTIVVWPVTLLIMSSEINIKKF